LFLIPEGLRRPEVRALLAQYGRVAGVRKGQIVIATALAAVVMVVEAASYALLIPLADAFSANSFAPVADSRVFGWIVDLLPAAVRSSPQRDAALVALLLVLIVALRIAKVSLAYGLRRYMHRREEGYLARIQHYTFTRVLSRSRLFFDTRPLGGLSVEISWARAFVDLLAAAERVIERTLSLLGKGVVLVALSLPLSLTLIAALPLIQGAARRISRAIEGAARAGDEVERRISSQALDLLGAVSLVKSSGAEGRAAEEYEGLLSRARDIAIRRRDLLALRWPVEETLVLLTLLLAQGVAIAAAGDFRPGDLARTAAFLLLVSQMLPDLKQWSDFSTAVAERVPRLEALADLMADDESTRVHSGTTSFRTLEHGIDLRDLRFAYGDAAETIKGLNLHIPAGQTTAIVGASGSGKSTLLRLLGRLYECGPGMITFDGQDVRSFATDSVHQQLAFVSQEVWVLNRSMRDNLTYGLERDVSDPELLQMLATVQLQDLLAEDPRVLDRQLGERGIQLSGGQRQRLALARALLRAPSVLLLDEATAALDSVIEQRIAQAIFDQTRGKTVIMVAHRLSTVRDADLIVVMRDGQIVEQGSWHELLARDGDFAALHRAQFSEAERVST